MVNNEEINKVKDAMVSLGMEKSVINTWLEKLKLRMLNFGSGSITFDCPDLQHYLTVTYSHGEIREIEKT